MATLNKSKQRDAILEYLKSTKLHPTAETVYENIRKDFPRVSLGTVYRNLTLLSDLGKIQKIVSFDGPDRFDYNEKPHAHLLCSNCGKVIDLDVDLSQINLIASKNFDGVITSHSCNFLGLCPDCANEQ